jgi:selenocysteine-specific elongation factor
VHVHVGSGEQRASLRLLDDAGSYARVRLAVALPLAPGDRMVLRSSGRQATVGGAEVLDIEPALRTRDAIERLQRPLGARVMAARPWVLPEELPVLTGAPDAPFVLVESGDAVSVGAWLVAPDELTRLRQRAVGTVRAEPGPGVDLASLASACGVETTQLRAALAREPAVVVERELVRDATRLGPAEDPAAMALVEAIEARPFDPPAPQDLGATPALVRALVRAGLLVDLDGVVFGARALAAAREAIVATMRERGAVTVSDVRDVLHSSRKYVLPILNRLDAEGVTRRRGDDRVAGPRA